MKLLLKYLFILSILLSACSNTNNFTEQPEVTAPPITSEDNVEEDEEIGVTLEPLEVSISTWLVDWDYESSIEETSKELDYIDNVLLFTTYFNETGNLMQTENATKLLYAIFDKVKFRKKEIYITVINDRIFGDKTSIQKDPTLLESILKTSTSRTQHIKDLLLITDQHPIDGIEIDYENIPTDLIDEFLLFISELNERLIENNLSLRVILEPRFPIEDYTLPTDIKFIMMAYNLYGFGTEPGPKADFEFLDSLIKRFPNDNQNIGFALATGGFRWTNDHTVSLTNHDIELIIDQFEPDLVRDAKSGSVTFTYFDNGVASEIWYADETTLNRWGNYLIENGNYNDLSIWRSGGLTKENLTIFEALKNYND